MEVVEVEMLDPGAPHDANLMPAIDRVVKRAGLRPRDVGAVAVSIGPGGYTAVRVGVTTAKFIAEATGARSYGVPSALVVAARVERDGSAFGVALGSKDDSVHLTRFCAEGRAVDGGRIVRAEDLDGTLGRLVSDRFLPRAIRERAEALGVRMEMPRFDSVACAEVALELEAVDPGLLVPMYPREAEAVTKWRALKAKGVKG